MKGRPDFFLTTCCPAVRLGKVAPPFPERTAGQHVVKKKSGRPEGAAVFALRGSYTEKHPPNNLIQHQLTIKALIVV